MTILNFVIWCFKEHDKKSSKKHLGQDHAWSEIHRCGGVGVFRWVSAVASETVAVGPETNLPLPRFVSLKAGKANIRRGPGLTYRIDWIFPAPRDAA